MLLELENHPAGGGGIPAGEEPRFSFTATDVTETFTLEATDVQRSTPVNAVARALAGRMALPANVPWALRDEQTGAYLDEVRPIGDQIQSGARVALTPKTHLG